MTTTERPAKFAFITNPAPKEAVLNVQIEDEELQRFRLNRDHLFALNAQTADILLKDFK
jgi:hypothetical protein